MSHRFFITLTDEEYEQLREAAHAERRGPQAQAAWMISEVLRRQALLKSSPEEILPPGWGKR